MSTVLNIYDILFKFPILINKLTQVYLVDFTRGKIYLIAELESKPAACDNLRLGLSERLRN
jgi:hypothetical protein